MHCGWVEFRFIEKGPNILEEASVQCDGFESRDTHMYVCPVDCQEPILRLSIYPHARHTLSKSVRVVASSVHSIIRISRAGRDRGDHHISRSSGRRDKCLTMWRCIRGNERWIVVCIVGVAGRRRKTRLIVSFLGQ